GPDLVGRLIAARLSETLGQPVVVENRVGGNGVVAGDAVVRAAPDGYTLLVGMDSLVAINPHLYERMPFDPVSDLVPVASLVSNGFFLVVNPQLPVHNLAEFIEYAKRANPPLHYASGGNGSQHHLTMERLKGRAGIGLVHIPYKGGAGDNRNRVRRGRGDDVGDFHRAADQGRAPTRARLPRAEALGPAARGADHRRNLPGFRDDAVVRPVRADCHPGGGSRAAARGGEPHPQRAGDPR